MSSFTFPVHSIIIAVKKILIILLPSICHFGISLALAHVAPDGWQYVFPNPGAQSVSCKTTVILRPGIPLPAGFDPRTIAVSVLGETSGPHKGSVILSEDGHTLIFKPGEQFAPGENVAVTVDAPALGLPLLVFRFSTSNVPYFDPAVWNETSTDVRPLNPGLDQSKNGTMTVINGVAVPADFPKMKVTVSKPTDKGKIFIANWGGTSYMMILENDGTPYFYKRFPGSGQTRDFKVQPTGTLTRRVYENLNCYVEMDSQYTNIDTLRCGHGYGTDEHEVQLLPNHHCFLIALDYRQVDMSKLITGGNANATVIGNHIQELDANHNVVFEWRSWDNFAITDAVHENLKGATIDYVHMNSIAIDYDSNIVISSRHLNELTKIDRKTGRIMWRLGGAHNQFMFLNDPYGISYQHDARPVRGKPDQYTVFDDGNFHSPPFTRVVEYKVDTTTMTVTKVWEYRHSPDYYTGWMGSAQRLANGNTFIDWSDNPLPKAHEVTPSGETVYEANFAQAMPCYRAFRFEWESVVEKPYLVAESYSDRVTLIFNKFGDKRVKRYIVYAGPGPNPTTPMDSTANTWIDLTRLSNQWYYFRVTARDSGGVESPPSNEEKMLVNLIPPGENLVTNGDFSSGLLYWQFNVLSGGDAGSAIMNGGEYGVVIRNGGSQLWSVQVVQPGIPLLTGHKYKFEFDAHASGTRTIDTKLEQDGGSYFNYSQTSTVALTKVKTHTSFTFTMTNVTDPAARVSFNLGMKADTVYLDNVSVKEILTSDVADAGQLPRRFAIEQNYPNPFNPLTFIKYTIGGTGGQGLGVSGVSLVVFDVLGREVAVLVNERKAPGTYQVTFDGSGLASGLYLYRLTAGMYVETRKMLLIR